jgi:undecaprenyl-diphosphatase
MVSPATVHSASSSSILLEDRNDSVNMLMQSPSSTPAWGTLQRVLAVDMRLCQWLNRLSRRDVFGAFFAGISRLGDGVFWYSLMLILPLWYGFAGMLTSLHMACTGILTLLLYKWLKGRTSRSRPCAIDQTLTRPVAPLDEFSFPSGHTLHAVTFTILLLGHHPAWFWVVVPFTLLVALSRPILGLHYPSDVLAAIVLGMAIGHGSLSLGTAIGIL